MGITQPSSEHSIDSRLTCQFPDSLSNNFWLVWWTRDIGAARCVATSQYIYFPVGNVLYKLDVVTGATDASRDFGVPISQALAFAERDGIGRIYLITSPGTDGNILRCVRADTLADLWGVIITWAVYTYSVTCHKGTVPGSGQYVPMVRVVQINDPCPPRYNIGIVFVDWGDGATYHWSSVIPPADGNHVGSIRASSDDVTECIYGSYRPWFAGAMTYSGYDLSPVHIGPAPGGTAFAIDGTHLRGYARIWTVEYEAKHLRKYKLDTPLDTEWTVLNPFAGNIADEPLIVPNGAEYTDDVVIWSGSVAKAYTSFGDGLGGATLRWTYNHDMTISRIYIDQEQNLFITDTTGIECRYYADRALKWWVAIADAPYLHPITSNLLIASGAGKTVAIVAPAPAPPIGPIVNPPAGPPVFPPIVYPPIPPGTWNPSTGEFDSYRTYKSVRSISNMLSNLQLGP